MHKGHEKKKKHPSTPAIKITYRHLRMLQTFVLGFGFRKKDLVGHHGQLSSKQLSDLEMEIQG